MLDEKNLDEQAVEFTEIAESEMEQMSGGTGGSRVGFKGIGKFKAKGKFKFKTNYSHSYSYSYDHDYH